MREGVEKVSMGEGRSAKKILIVDDESDFIEIMKARLEKEGYKVEGITDPSEARWVMRSAPPDLVVLDLNMPGQTGFELLTSLPRQIGAKRIFILVFTARHNPDDEADVMALGADGFFLKATDDRALIEKISELLD